VLYNGLALMGGGAILGGVILGAIAACIIDRQLRKASGFAFAGAVLTFFGFMHGEAIGVAQTPSVAVSYLLVAILLAACAKYSTVSQRAPVHADHESDAMPEPAR
jgi:AGZA family xanthine/uracil permease-like MFS transporter